MKITKISTVVVNAEMRNWVFVKVETDQPGLAGWGEATLEWKPRSVVGAVEAGQQDAHRSALIDSTGREYELAVEAVRVPGTDSLAADGPRSNVLDDGSSVEAKKYISCPEIDLLALWCLKSN